MSEPITRETVWLVGAGPGDPELLTLRGSARKLTFITAHARTGEQLNIDWVSLADRSTTLAV